MTSLDLLLLHTAVTWALVGLIWVVQLVQYPAFALVGAPERVSFHEYHCARLTRVVGPLMLAEGLTAVALLAAPPAGVPVALLWTGLALLAVNALSTAFLAVPLHRRFGREAERVQRGLVAVNWIRTAAWSARGALVLAALRGAVAA